MKTSIYLTSALVEQGHALGLNLSAICRRAIQDAINGELPGSMPDGPTAARVKLVPPTAGTGPRCTVTGDDGREREYPVFALSLRGAQRDVTGRLIAEGYRPVGSWIAEGDSAIRCFEASRGDA